MSLIAEDASNVAKLLKVDDDQNLYVTEPEGTYKYAQVSDDTSGTTGTIWDPATGKELHISGMFFYASGAGAVEIYDNASGTTIALFEFTQQGTKVITFNIDIVLSTDDVLGVKWTSGAGTRTLDVTAFGHEH